MFWLARSTGVAGLRRAVEICPCVRKPASTMFDSTSAARARAGRQVHIGREFRRRLEQPGNHGGFGQAQVTDILAEIMLGSGLDTKHAIAQIGAVQIELQDLALGQAGLEPQSQEGFLDLAFHRTLIVQEQVLGQLLGDGGAALHHAIARAFATIARKSPCGSMPQ